MSAKTKAGIIRSQFIFAILLAALSTTLIAAAEPAPQTELDIVLGDGAKLVGIALETKFEVTTEFGALLIPLKLLRRIEFNELKKKFLFTLRNQDEVIGLPKNPGFALKTVAGDLKVPFKKVMTIDFVTIVPAKKETLGKGLQVHFKFNQAEGGDIVNESKPTEPAKLVDGKREKGTITLDGQGDHIHLSNDDSFEKIDTFSVSIWAKLKSFGPGGYANEQGYLVNKGDDMWWNPAWCLGYTKKSGAGKRGVHPGPLPALFIIGTEVKGGTSKCRVNSKALLKIGKWYHVVGTYDGKMARIYVNGQLDGEREHVEPVRKDGAPLLLGGGKLGGTTFGNHFTTDASIDNFRFYNRPLTHGEIRLLHKIEAK